MSIAPPFKPSSSNPRSYFLSQPYHLRGTSYNPSPHLALDQVGSMGQPVYAAESGKVFAAEWNGRGWAIGGGYTVIIDHIGADNRRSKSAYAHLSRIMLGQGRYVVRGQLIGYAGATGNASGAHCHFSYGLVKSGGNPLAYYDYVWSNPAAFFSAHVFQNGSWPTGPSSTNSVTRCTAIVGVAANGASRPTNLRSGPYLSSPIIRTVSSKTLLVGQGTVIGSSWNGSRTWQKGFDQKTGKFVYVHSSLRLWVA